jgi:hypothetical protein
MPFNLSLPPYGFNRFCYRRSLQNEIQGSCYPFYTTRLTLLWENGSENFLDVQTLFNSYESIHYHRNARALRWRHNYYLEGILDSSSSEEDQRYFREDIITVNKANLAILVDPLHLNFQEKKDWKQSHFGLLHLAHYSY